MKFTFTTSFYKNCEHVHTLYDAIKAQTYKNWEWIVTDDFSESSCSKELLLNISKNDRRVKYVEQSFKKEMFWNPQTFCKNAEIIIQMDSDDLPLPKALEVYHHFFTKFPDVILIICSCHHIDEKNKRWKWYDFLDDRLFNNLSCGYMTFFRAWRNRDIPLDFNPNNEMKQYFNDYSLVCSLEEHGKVLSLPRDLYARNVRDGSISRTPTDIFSVENERINLTNKIKKRRANPEFDSFNRYFDPILDFKYCFADISFGRSSEQIKFSFYSRSLNSQRQNLLKELFFDHDIHFNKIDGDEDYVFFDVKDMRDIEDFILAAKNFSIKNLICVINKSFFDIDNLFDDKAEILLDLDKKPVYKGLKFKDLYVKNLNNENISNLFNQNNFVYHFMSHPQYDFYRLLR